MDFKEFVSVRFGTTQGASKQINTVLGLCTHFTLIYKFLHRGWTTRYVADKTLRGHYVLEYRKHF